jgi:hypothetical protein
MSSNSHGVLSWVVRRTRLPLVVLNCVDCSSGRATVGSGKFRVNANGKLLDVWLLVNCVGCDRTSKITVHERVPVGRMRADLLRGYTANSSELAAVTLLNSSQALDWDGCWELRAPEVPEEPWPMTVAVAFDDPVPVRPEQLIAHGLGISRAEVRRRVKIDVPLNRRTTRGFEFVVMRPPDNYPGPRAGIV